LIGRARTAREREREQVGGDVEGWWPVLSVARAVPQRQYRRLGAAFMV
jgi:hypothetical protein